MTTTVSNHVPMNIIPGVCPPSDSTESSTDQFTGADKIRFVGGYARKIGGWVNTILNGATIEGCVRSIFSANIGQKVQTVLGSDEGYYALIGSDLTNLTPLQTTTIAIPDSIDPHYETLTPNPLAVVSGSTTIRVTDSEASLFKEGDLYVLFGATDVGGIPAASINTTHIVRSIETNIIEIIVPDAATSTTSGGGATVVRSSGLLTINANAHGQSNDDRTKINDSTDVQGITAAQINLEFLIRNVQTNSFDVMTEGVASGSGSGEGGAATTYQVQIPDGLCDVTSGQGYGMGRYGTGLYGTALVSENSKRFPRIWFNDLFGENIITTPGNGLNVYSWNGDLTTAPTIIANAPTQVNYIFVSDNILVTLGADGISNKIKASDQGNVTQWTSSSTNQVFEDFIEGSNELLSHVSLNGTNLLFTNNECYTFRYIGLPFIWEIKFKDNIGCIAPMARVVVNGVAYWMGENNFYMWRGGNVEVIPSNTRSETTLLNYVFENINRAQAAKSFAWYNKRYDEIWFHYPSANSNEVDSVARYHVTEFHWVPDTFDRTAAEYPNINLQFPRLIDSNNNLYRHEIGTDDDVNAMQWSLKTNYRSYGTNNVMLESIIPDSIQTQNITLTIDGYSYPQSSLAKNTSTITITPTTEYVALDVDARFLQFTMSGNAVGQNWIMGEWLEPIQQSSRSE